ncbi:ABC transporter ATP-binding protein [Candidatus Saccharibacteria bacterium]|nr:ABC transporter ATP-binding protein [Candidatus Saccharibacteria bacterium]
MSKRKIGIRKEVLLLDSPYAIEVKKLSKSFRLPTERSWGLKQAIFNRLRGIKGYKDQKVLRDVSFNVKKGEFLGIVGRNGSGKSTLLKILSGIYYPEKGEITVNGSLVPFIELGVGFNPELTGRENVYLNGALLGFSHKEMDAMYEDIWKFAELEQFQDQKLKNYSSGMQVRLAFSIAIRAKGNILILDEVLAVGDAAFQQKCNEYFASLKGKQTVILVTHSMENVKKFCDRAIMIEDGKIVQDGDPKEVAEKYMELFK